MILFRRQPSDTGSNYFPGWTRMIRPIVRRKAGREVVPASQEGEITRIRRAFDRQMALATPSGLHWPDYEGCRFPRIEPTFAAPVTPLEALEEII